MTMLMDKAEECYTLERDLLKLDARIDRLRPVDSQDMVELYKTFPRVFVALTNRIAYE